MAPLLNADVLCQLLAFVDDDVLGTLSATFQECCAIRTACARETRSRWTRNRRFVWYIPRPESLWWALNFPICRSFKWVLDLHRHPEKYAAVLRTSKLGGDERICQKYQVPDNVDFDLEDPFKNPTVIVIGRRKDVTLDEVGRCLRIIISDVASLLNVVAIMEIDSQDASAVENLIRLSISEDEKSRPWDGFEVFRSLVRDGKLVSTARWMDFRTLTQYSNGRKFMINGRDVSVGATGKRLMKVRIETQTA